MRFVVKKSVYENICNMLGIEKAHKYIRRWKLNNGEWGYEYPKQFDKKIHSMADVVTDFANRTIEIKDKKLLTTEDEIDAELDRLSKLADEGNLICPALGNNVIYIEDQTKAHAERTTYGIINKVSYYDEKKKKQITTALEIVVAWDNENKRFVFSFIDRKIKKS